jgi:hypothetical protein
LSIQLSVVGNQLSVIKKNQMKKFILLLTLSFFAFVSANAQTKKIALASHSGKKSEFKIDGDGNFGETPEMAARYEHYMDSIRKIDSTRKADSIQKAKQQSPHKKQGRRAKGVHAATFVLKPKNTMAVK